MFTFFSGKYKSDLKIPLGEAGCLGNPYFLLTGCLGIQFLIHYAALRDIQDAMPCHWSIGHTSAFYPYYPGKRTIPLRVTSILSICLRSHT